MLIGITGGIGSGKSTIAKQLRERGYAVYDTDSEAKRLIIEDERVREQMIALFGKDVYKDGKYQTHIVAQKVFNNSSMKEDSKEDLLSRLNAIVHPAVKQDILRWVSEKNNATQDNAIPYFVECAILYQAGFDELCDKVVMITAPEAVRIERTIARDQTTIDRVRARIHAQSTEEDIQRADIIINNDGTTPISALCKMIIANLNSIVRTRQEPVKNP